MMMILLLTAASCTKDSTGTSLPMDSIAASNFSFIKNIQASNEANQLRSADYSAPFEILKVVRDKELLTITVNFPEGCGDSKFNLIWNGLTLESNPEVIILYLRRTTDCGSSGNPASRILSLNLSGCLGDASLAQSVKIILCNASKKANTENSDITVSSN
jgi:hypothetical protein